MTDILLILLILLLTIGLFLSGRWRHDIVALTALLLCVVLGLVPESSAFSGFAHPAVVTVAAVLILSQGLQDTGVIDSLARRVIPTSRGPLLTVSALAGLGALLSAFMNNVGAMALLMPMALQIANKLEIPPGRLLMPLAFGTILGGMTTLIGTPPNLIVSGFRAETQAGAFSMFSYTPVGLTVCLVGVLFLSVIGWRLVPRRSKPDSSGFVTGAYLSEAKVGEESESLGKSVRELEQLLSEKELDAQITGLVRNGLRLYAPQPGRRLSAGDILVLECEPDTLAEVISCLTLELTERDRPVMDSEPKIEAKDLLLQEWVVMPTSLLLGRSANDIYLSVRFGLNLLAISRHGQRSVRRMRSTPFCAGDVLLLQGTEEAQAAFAAGYGCLPLAEREIRIPGKSRAPLACVILLLVIATSATGLLSAAVAFTCGVFLFAVCGLLPLRQLYDAIDWSVIVLLGCMIPVAGAMASTGAADWLAGLLLLAVPPSAPVIALALVLIVTMTLSDFMNNAATAAVMSPLALSISAQLGVNGDTFLMAVAIGASCAFLTPIGHQNNTLILGPGGFLFGDYWRLGLPMEILVVMVSLPMLLVVWPL